MIVFLTALGVGGATVMGSIIGFLFRSISQRFRNVSMAFAAGLMLAAAIWGLILPAMECGNIFTTFCGFFAGAFCLDLLDRFTPNFSFLTGLNAQDTSAKEILLFVTAIAVHNFPEGIAAGVSFGSGDPGSALLICGSIALQNLPEGMVIVAPMLTAGISPRRTMVCAFLSGMVEVVGTFLGYFAVTAASALLPFALAYAGGTMLYVICDEMIPRIHSGSSGCGVTYALLVGFFVMLVMDALME